MATDLQSVLYKVSYEVIALDKGRIANDEPVDFQNLREAMIVMHTAWQSFMTVVRNQHEPKLAADAVIQVAAAAAKLATDLGEDESTSVVLQLRPKDQLGENEDEDQ